MKIIFAGTPIFAERHLQSMIDSKHDVCAVYTQPDRPAGRGKKLMPSPVKQLAQEHDIAVYQPASLKNEDAQRELASLNADLMIVVAYGLLLPKAVLDAPRLGCINVHGSILPRWRGAAPIQRAIETGDAQTGITIMQMDEGLDTGAMLLKTYCDILDTDTSASLHDRLCELGPPALLDTIAQLENGTATPEVQDDALSNYAPKIEKMEAKIDWQASLTKISRAIRAFNPFPICYAEINGERVKIHEATTSVSEHALPSLAPAQIHCEHGKLFVGASDGVLEIQRIQFPGKKAMRVQDYLNGSGNTFPATHFDT